MASYYISQLINGLCQGAVYALLAVGYTMIVGVVGMVSFTYGDVMMMSAYAAFYVFTGLHTNFIVSALGAIVAGFVLGFLVYKVCYERFLDAPRVIIMICTMGWGTLLSNLSQIVFGLVPKPYLNVIPNKIFTLGLVQIRLSQILIICITIVLALVLAYIVKYTRFGISLRAVSQNKQAAYLMGINVKRTILLGSCIAYAVGGACGVLLALYYQSVYTSMGSAVTMKAFASSIVGGLADTRLSALGGMIIGFVENMGISISAASYRDIFTFGFLILVLTFRPKGFGKKGGMGI